MEEGSGRIGEEGTRGGVEEERGEEGNITDEIDILHGPTGIQGMTKI